MFKRITILLLAAVCCLSNALAINVERNFDLVFNKRGTVDFGFYADEGCTDETQTILFSFLSADESYFIASAEVFVKYDINESGSLYLLASDSPVYENSSCMLLSDIADAEGNNVKLNYNIYIDGGAGIDRFVESYDDMDQNQRRIKIGDFDGMSGNTGKKEISMEIKVDTEDGLIQANYAGFLILRFESS